MKKLILIAILVLSASTSFAQALLELKGDRLETDQPGVVIKATPMSSISTTVEFSMIFKCKEFVRSYCTQYVPGTTSHVVEFQFPSGVIEGFYSFMIVYDVKEKKFVVNFRPYSNDNVKIEINSGDKKTVISVL